MHKIGDDTGTADGNGEFKEAPASTDLRSDYMNTLQREMVAVVEEYGGETLDPANDKQISEALKKRQFGRAHNSPAAAMALGLTYEQDRANHTVTDPGGIVQGVYYGAGFIWVTNFIAESLSKIDPVTMTIVATYDFGASRPNGPMVSDGTYLWVTCDDSGSPDPVYRITISDGTITGPITVGASPQSIVYANGFIYVANITTDNISKIDPATATVISTIALAAGASPWGMCYDGTHVWIANSANDTMSLLAPADDSLSSFGLPVGDSPAYPIFDGRSVWVCARGRSLLLRIDLVTKAILVALPSESSAGEMVFDGYSLYSNASSTSTLLVWDNLMWSRSQSLIGSWSAGVTFDGRYIWYGIGGGVTRMLVR